MKHYLLVNNWTSSGRQMNQSIRMHIVTSEWKENENKKSSSINKNV